MTMTTYDPARRWLTTLAARGVTAEIRNGRLHLSPPDAWRALSNAERAVYQQNRAHIKDLVRSGGPYDVTETPTEIPAPEPPRRPTAAEKRRADELKLKAADLDAYGVLYPDDPDYVEHRRKKATAVMMRQVGRPSPHW
jgi:hypothetical protein